MILAPDALSGPVRRILDGRDADERSAAAMEAMTILTQPIEELILELPTSWAPLAEHTTIMTNNVILADGTDNVVTGDVDTILFEYFPKDASDIFAGAALVTFGDDILFAQTEDTITLTGDAELISSANDKTDFEFLGWLTPTGLQYTGWSFDFGDDVIVLSAGNGILTGDVGYMLMELFAWAPDFLGRDSVISATFQYGDDLLISGSGRDMLVGDVREARLHNFIDIESHENAEASQVHIFGDDYLQSGAGGDLLFGDFGPGNNDDDPYAIFFRPADPGLGTEDILSQCNGVLDLRFGDDTLDGGAGNDALYGDMAGLYMFVYNGVELTLAFGDDHLIGGAGNDYIVGDIYDYYIYKPDGFLGDYQFYYLNGDDTLEGGAGDDILIGDTADTFYQITEDDIFDDSTPDDPRIYQHIAGHDTFVFAPGSGHDQIVDFQREIDTLDLTAYGFSSIGDIDYEFVGDDLLIDLDGTEDDIASILILGGNIYETDVLI